MRSTTWCPLVLVWALAAPTPSWALSDVAAACAACHGQSGEGRAALGSPRLAGLPASYLRSQMQEFADGRRPSPIMTPIAHALPARELAQITASYARLHGLPVRTVAPAPQGAVGAGAARDAQVLLARGAQLANRGRWHDEIPACTQCHGQGGSGVGASFPALAGQPSVYLQNQLRAWQSGTRDPGPMGMMGAVAMKLSPSDINAVAAYFSSLVPGAPVAQLLAEPAALPSQSAAPQPASHPPTLFSPPDESQMPAGEFGRVVKLGEQIFDDTALHARDYVGNQLRCSSCHLDRGRRADSAPLWAAYLAYPAYRAKNGHVNTYAERLQGCFRYSMNGKAPPLGSPILVALETYSYWLATGARVDADLPGRGYPRVKSPQHPDYARGRHVYAARCALCHGGDGAGQSANDGSMTFPALWGDRSFNWGAGMADVDNAAAFIEANMPLSQDHTLTDQQAWDVALYMDSHERPQDPRFSGSVQATRSRFHDSAESMYGLRVGAHVLGDGSTPPGGSLRPSTAAPN